jgi:hypothetical protein
MNKYGWSEKMTGGGIFLQNSDGGDDGGSSNDDGGSSNDFTFYCQKSNVMDFWRESEGLRPDGKTDEKTGEKTRGRRRRKIPSNKGGKGDINAVRTPYFS